MITSSHFPPLMVITGSPHLCPCVLNLSHANSVFIVIFIFSLYPMKTLSTQSFVSIDSTVTFDTITSKLPVLFNFSWGWWVLSECTRFYPHSIPNIRKWFEKKHLNYTLFGVFKFITLFLFFRLSFFQPVFFICSVEVAFRFLNLKTPFVDNSCHS